MCIRVRNQDICQFSISKMYILDIYSLILYRKTTRKPSRLSSCECWVTGVTPSTRVCTASGCTASRYSSDRTLRLDAFRKGDDTLPLCLNAETPNTTACFNRQFCLCALHSCISDKEFISNWNFFHRFSFSPPCDITPACDAGSELDAIWTALKNTQYVSTQWTTVYFKQHVVNIVHSLSALRVS